MSPNLLDLLRRVWCALLSVPFCAHGLAAAPSGTSIATKASPDSGGVFQQTVALQEPLLSNASGEKSAPASSSPFGSGRGHPARPLSPEAKTAAVSASQRPHFTGTAGGFQRPPLSTEIAAKGAESEGQLRRQAVHAGPTRLLRTVCRLLFL